MQDQYWARLDSPIGPLTVTVDEDGALTAIDVTGIPGSGAQQPTRCAEPLRQLGEYFAGQRTEFDLRLKLTGSDFQQQVWRALGQIPYGELLSYAELARVVGRPKAARAVGQANGANRIPIVVPCHRVVTSSGGIGGYAGGVHIKRHLLAHEGSVTPQLMT